MSISKPISGDIYIIPEVQEYDWGDNVTDLLVRTTEDLDGTFQQISASGPTTVVNFSYGKNIDITLTSNTVLTLTNPRGGRPAVFWIYQTSAFTITWPIGTRWPGGLPPAINLGPGVYLVTLVYNQFRAEYIGDYGTLRYS